jgi:hypothetical protein
MGLSPPNILFPSGSYLNEVDVRFKLITLYPASEDRSRRPYLTSIGIYRPAEAIGV